MTATETFALGDWVTVGPNLTNAPQGIAKITTITDNGSLIVAVGHGMHKHLVPAACCTRHAGPPPGRELLPLTRETAPAAEPLQALVASAATEPAEEPPRSARAVWHIGDRVEIARDQRDGPPAGTVGRIFGFSAVPGYLQVKTDAGVIVVDGQDLAVHIPAGPQRCEREAAARAAQPRPEPSRLKLGLAKRREQQAGQQSAPGEAPAPPGAIEDAPAANRHGNTGRKRGPVSEETKQRIREGQARAKAERAARNRFSDVTVEEIPDPDTAPEPVPPTLRLVERPPVASPAVAAATAVTLLDDASLPAAGVDDALRWAIGQGARQRLSVAALRMMVDTLEAVEQEIQR